MFMRYAAVCLVIYVAVHAVGSWSIDSFILFPKTSRILTLSGRMCT